MRRMALGLISFLAFAGLSPASAPATAQDLFPGWTAGPADDATMDKGRRFDCVGGACPPSGLSCLFARTPEGEPLWREVPTKDLMRPKGMPWKEIDAWLAGKVLALRPELVGTPAVDVKTWAVAEPSRLVGGGRFMAKRYAAGAVSVPTAFWMAGGRMNVVVCVGTVGEEDAAWVRVEGLVGEVG